MSDQSVRHGKHFRISLVTTVFFLVALVGQLFVLRELPYSTARLSGVAMEAMKEVPSPNFAAGDISWRVSEFATSPDLEPFRRSFESTCQGLQPVQAALCVSDRMASQFPHGDPPSEFVDAVFDPLTHLQIHSQGRSGHCVTRSSIMAAELLAVGIPARLVQLSPLDGSGGHNLVEVYQEDLGWVMVDPTYGGLVGDASGPKSVLEMVGRPDAVRWFQRGMMPEPFQLTTAEIEELYRPLLRAAVVYPEPWLYLREGRKVAHWPYRGAYVHTGPGAFKLGPAQRC